jgi:hypothetical protein
MGDRLGTLRAVGILFLVSSFFTQKKSKKNMKVSPRFELGSSDSESEVLTITPRNLSTTALIFAADEIWPKTLVVPYLILAIPFNLMIFLLALIFLAAKCSGNSPWKFSI